MQTKLVEKQLDNKTPCLMIRLFRGDITLPITYWVFGFLIGNIGSRVITKVVELNYLSISSSQLGIGLLIVLDWVILAYAIFIGIAVWRSAGKYQGETYWAVFVYMIVIFSAISLIFSKLDEIVDNVKSDRAMHKTVTIVNQSLPSMQDEEIRLDYLSIEDKDLFYNFTLVNWMNDELDIPFFISEMTPVIRTEQCSNEKVRQLFNRGWKLVYVYQDKAEEPIARIVLDEAACL